MSGINSAYDGSEDGRWVHLHTKKCAESFETIYPIVERVTSLLPGNVPTQAELIEFIKRNIEEDKPGELTDDIKTQIAKQFIEDQGLNGDLSDMPIAARTAVGKPYQLFSSLCQPIEPGNHNVPDSDFVIYNLDKGIIPDNIIEALKVRCFGFYYYILGTTREEHYKQVIEEVIKSGKMIKGRLNSDMTISQKGSSVIVESGVQYNKLGIHPRYALDKFSGIFSFLYKRRHTRAVHFDISIPASAYDKK